jgi:pyrroloquinoline quinone (PQQ) biosynthesis protein C
MTAELGQSLATLIRSLGSNPASSTLSELERRTDEAVLGAFLDGDKAAELDVHRFLYEINAHRILPPWAEHWHDYEHPVVLAAHRKTQDAWLDHDRMVFAAGLELPASSAEFADWATKICEDHPSGVSHPLFAFLANDASFEQLRCFSAQETPLDIHFSDLIALLLPGIHGEQKIELAMNFWDEMGNGRADVTHRQLRLAMMRSVGISPDGYLADIDWFWPEELRLANMYFQAAADRRLAPQAVGMLLATELVVPGRMDRQVDGWRRVGLPDQEMHFLLEHATVDLTHGQGWLDHVVAPLAATHPELLPEVAIGMLRRLDGSLRVCDRAMSEFTSIM